MDAMETSRRKILSWSLAGTLAGMLPRSRDRAAAAPSGGEIACPEANAGEPAPRWDPKKTFVVAIGVIKYPYGQ